MKSTILTFASLLFLSTSACAVVDEKQDQPLKMSIKSKTIDNNQNKSSTDNFIKTIPVVATIKNGKDEIDFLSNTATNKQNTDNQTAVFLRSINGKHIYYDKNAIKSMSSADGATKELITYNKRRKLVGIFNGVINIEANDKADITNIITDYKLTTIIVINQYATLKITNLNDTQTIVKAMRADARIKKVTLKIKEDEIVKH